MGAYSIIVMALSFFLVLAVIVLQLVIFNTHVDVQHAPYNTLQHKTTINKLARFDIAAPFVLGALMLSNWCILGVILIAPCIYLSAIRIYHKQIFMDSTTNYNRIKSEELKSIIKVINLFVLWIYILVKFILTLVRD